MFQKSLLLQWNGNASFLEGEDLSKNIIMHPDQYFYCFILILVFLRADFQKLIFFLFCHVFGSGIVLNEL